MTISTDQTVTAKLSPAQFILLAGLSERPSYVAEHYGPLKKLLTLGFVEARDSKYSHVYHVTDEGRRALNEA